MDAALRIAADQLMGGDSVQSRLESVTYVETTVGAARKLFSPDKPIDVGVADDVNAWAFVAYGQFQDFCMGCEIHVSPVSSTLVVVIPKDGEGWFFTGGDDRYDLIQLGTPREVPALLLEQICDKRISPGKAQDTYCGVYAGDH